MKEYEKAKQIKIGLEVGQRHISTRNYTGLAIRRSGGPIRVPETEKRFFLTELITENKHLNSRR
jgi:hypothetical protein